MFQYFFSCGRTRTPDCWPTPWPCATTSATTWSSLPSHRSSGCPRSWWGRLRERETTRSSSSISSSAIQWMRYLQSHMYNIWFVKNGSTYCLLYIALKGFYWEYLFVLKPKHPPYNTFWVIWYTVGDLNNELAQYSNGRKLFDNWIMYANLVNFEVYLKVPVS